MVLLLTKEEMPEAIAVIGSAGAEQPARVVPDAAGGVDGGPEHDGARHVAEHANRELDHTHRHRFV